jgi:hypothetical protein
VRTQSRCAGSLVYHVFVSVSLSDVDDLIARYGAAEQAGRARVPNRAIQAFSLDVFQAVGYPHRISSSRELWRYHDVMQDGRLEHNLGLLGSAMDGEVDLVRRAADAIVSFSVSTFGFASAGKDMLSRAVYQYSLLASVLDGVPRPWTILEVGPGCGYLGVLLGLAGHRYIALEASQAFWVYQSALFEHVFGDEYSDGLVEGRRRISHLAWWDFCSEGSALPRLSACTANHVLNEMNRFGLEFVMRKLSSSQRVGMCIVAESLGAPKLRSNLETISLIAETGFSADEMKDCWLFRKTDGEATIKYYARIRSDFRIRILNLPVIGRTASLVWRLIRGSRRGRPVSRPTSSSVRAFIATLPDADSADHRFMSGTW